jgi:hypothetical protein
MGGLGNDRSPHRGHRAFTYGKFPRTSWPKFIQDVEAQREATL